MTKNKKKKPSGRNAAGKEKEQEKRSQSISDAWLSMRTGILAVGVASVLAGLWAGWQIGSALGFWEGVLWGFLFGGSIWLIFALALAFNRWVRRR